MELSKPVKRASSLNEESLNPRATKKAKFSLPARTFAESARDTFMYYVRNSRPKLFCKKGVLNNFAKFTRKHLCWILFFNKVAVLRPATVLKKRLQYRCFPVNFGKFSRTTFFTEHLWWRLLLCQEWTPRMGGDMELFKIFAK